ncbi:MAG TPA: VOC family protein [Candidatus Dormibacteraeota bacterium]
MERVEFLSAVLLTSREPDRLAAFYRDLLGIPLKAERHGESEQHWGCELGDVHFAIHPSSDRPGPGPIRLAFWVFDLEAFADRLEQAGTKCRYPIQQLGEGSLVTAVEDPDGNEVELTQMGDSWREHLAERRRGGADVIARAAANRPLEGA